MTTRLHVASVRARLTLTIAFALSALTLAFAATGAQAAAPDFTWSTTVSTAQAGGHPNLTYNYASSSTQSLTRLDVDLPQGLMHRNNLSGACSNPLYQGDSCPASSTVGTVSAQIVVRGATITVPGTIFQLSAPDADTDATFGIVLRPLLSSLGLTGKIFIRNQLSFIAGGGLRSSLVGPLSAVTVLGNTLPSRISQLKIQYNSQTPTGNIALVSNPTGCKAQTFTAVGTFSDASTKSKTSSFATTGCPAVPFAPTSDVQIFNNTAGQRTAFSASLLTARPGPSAALSPGHVVAIGHDFDQLGDFDYPAIDSGVLCTDAQAASTAGCPAASEIGDLSGDVEGFGAVTGKVYATNSPGHKTVGEITLRRVKVRFPGGLDGGNASTLSFDGLPQLPFTAFHFKATKPILKLTNTCAIRISRTSSRTFGDGHAVNQNTIPAPACPPTTAPQITAGPDRGITINTSHVEYRFSSPESGVTFECKKDDAAYKACASPFIDDWQGETAHVLSVRAVRGGLPGPATNATFTVDTVKPVVTLTSADDQDADNDGLADQPFRTPDFVVDIDLSDATSGVDWDKLDAYFQSDSDAVKHKAVPTRPHTQGHVQVGGDSLAAPPGPGTFTVTAYDLAGNATVVKLRLIIVSGQPTIIENNKLTLFTDAPTVEVPFEATDDVLKYPQGEMEFECYRKGWDGTVKGDPKKAKIITDRDTGRSKGFCTFADVPEGTYKVTVRGWDPVKKEAIAEGDMVVDRTAPKIDLVNPDDADKDGDGVADKRFRPSFFDVFMEISDLESGIDPSGTSCVAKVVNKGAIKGNVTINNANRVTCSFGGLPDGDVDVEITAKNYVGTVTIVKRTFTVDLTPPTVDFADPGDLDTDGDGFSDQRVRAARLGYHVWVSDSRIGVDPNSGACTAKNRKRGMVNGNVTINNGTLRCTFDGLPDGDTDIEISAADLFGNKKSLTTAVTIDSQASPDPVITINNPSQGQSIPQGGQIYAGYLITGAGPYAVKCLIDNVVVSTNCPSGTALSTAGLTTGPHLFQISAQDDFGNYGAERTFSIVPSGGGQACIAIYPPPPGCPGGPPLGGGGGPVIIVP